LLGVLYEGLKRKMAKLWDKGYSLDEQVERFTVWDDPELDLRLVKWDCVGSIAHARMLASIGVLTRDEAEKLRAGLVEIVRLAAQGKFRIRQDEEDVHTAVENYLVGKLGDIGKKLHTARSRNDQSALDLRLYMRDQMLAAAESLLGCSQTLLDFAQKHRDVPMPGRTHLQPAMPSSVGLWAGAFVESLLDDMEPLKAAYRVADQCPLGSAASYGVSLPIDRQMTSDLLGFSRVLNNVLYANNSRGKVEVLALSALLQIMMDLGKLATDVQIFSMPEFGYFILPEKYCGGSSLMPQKRNPAVFELTRARGGTLLGLLVRAVDIVRALPSGYNRDFQETKGAVIHGFDITCASLDVCSHVMADVRPDEKKLLAGFTPALFATDKVLELVQHGMPFRDAYRKVAAELDKLELPDPRQNILSKKHLGAPGNLRLELSVERIRNERAWVAESRRRWEKPIESLLARRKARRAR
jgi:argininosuccinate lyase